jgi:hypothetical protein
MGIFSRRPNVRSTEFILDLNSQSFLSPLSESLRKQALSDFWNTESTISEIDMQVYLASPDMSQRIEDVIFQVGTVTPDELLATVRQSRLLQNLIIRKFLVLVDIVYNNLIAQLKPMIPFDSKSLESMNHLLNICSNILSAIQEESTSDLKSKVEIVELLITSFWRESELRVAVTSEMHRSIDF